jgi:hypothetical protein
METTEERISHQLLVIDRTSEQDTKCMKVNIHPEA